jgi:3' exoribonuclease, RNase T-like
VRYFLDTEFMESGPDRPIVLLSIALVAEDGRELYFVNGNADYSQASEWVRANVFPHLFVRADRTFDWNTCLTSFKNMRGHIEEFCGEWPEFWGFYADYDWVVLCQIFGAMGDLPQNWPMYCRDLKQWCDDLHNYVLPPMVAAKHNALFNARWNRDVYAFLRKHSRSVAK